MYKYFSALFLCLLTTSVCALPIGNPNDASLYCTGILCDGFMGDPVSSSFSWCAPFSLRAGYYGDYVFNRHMEADHFLRNGDVNWTEIYTNAGYLAVNFCNRVDLFGTMGGTKFKIKSTPDAFSTSSTTTGYVSFETDTNFSWSAGVRATLWECGYFVLGAEGQYFYTKPSLSTVRVVDYSIFYPEDATVKYQEWQAGLGVSVPINIPNCGPILIPYIGVKWSTATMDLGAYQIPAVPLTFLDLKSKKAWGYAVGMTLIGSNKASFSIEGRFADELAASLNGQVRF